MSRCTPAACSTQKTPKMYTFFHEGRRPKGPLSQSFHHEWGNHWSFCLVGKDSFHLTRWVVVFRSAGLKISAFHPFCPHKIKCTLSFKWTLRGIPVVLYWMDVRMWILWHGYLKVVTVYQIFKQTFSNGPSKLLKFCTLALIRSNSKQPLKSLFNGHSESVSLLWGCRCKPWKPKSDGFQKNK